MNKHRVYGTVALFSVMLGSASAQESSLNSPLGVADASSAAPIGASAQVSPTPLPVRITGVTFDEPSHRRRARGSDNWPATWSDDDQQYALWGDGGGFGGSNRKGRASFGVARIEGDHHNYRGVNRYGGRNAECTSKIIGKSHGAPISIGGVLYAWITPKSDRAGYERFTLYRSSDKGCKWTRLNVHFLLERDGVSYGGFIQAGKDNTAAPDAYVYTVAPEVTDSRSNKIVQRPGRIMLLRAPAAEIELRGSYEFYAGLDSLGAPVWSKEAADKIPIYEDPDGVGPFPQVSYVPELARWVYTNEHGDGVDKSSRNSLLTMADAPHPWGPWNVFYRDVFFPANEQKIFQWNFAPKWFRDDGRRFTLIFSGDGGNDSWNTIDGTFEVASP